MNDQAQRLSHAIVDILREESYALTVEEIVEELEVAGHCDLLPCDQEQRWILIWTILRDLPTVEHTCSSEVVETVEQVHRFTCPY